MRLISNEELMVVAGGEYLPWDNQYIEDSLGSFGFEEFAFDGDYGWGKTPKKSTKPSDSEMAQIVAEFGKMFPSASVECVAEANNKGPDGAVEWSVKCTFTIKTKGSGNK